MRFYFGALQKVVISVAYLRAATENGNHTHIYIRTGIYNNGGSYREMAAATAFPLNVER